MQDDPRKPGKRVKEMELELARLSKLVYYDELTGLFNRRGFSQEAGHVFHMISDGNSPQERRTSVQIPLSIIFMDLDNFKALNDTHGHGAGDEALKMVAAVLQRNLRVGDLFGRIGGEEFVVALIGADPQRALLIAEKLHKALEDSKFVWKGKNITLTASFGVAKYEDEKSLTELIDKADRAMYEAKKGGKNRVAISKE